MFPGAILEAITQIASQARLNFLSPGRKPLGTRSALTRAALHHQPWVRAELKRVLSCFLPDLALSLALPSVLQQLQITTKICRADVWPLKPLPTPAVILILPCAPCTLIQSSKKRFESRQAQFEAYSSSHASCEALRVFCSRVCCGRNCCSWNSSRGFSRSFPVGQRSSARGWGGQQRYQHTAHL